MNCRLCLGIVGLAAITASVTFAQPAKDTKPGAKAPVTQPNTPPGKDAKPQLPPGMTEADMQACMEAGTPGEMHHHLAQGAGTWSGKSTMWMTPAAEAVKSECTTTVTPIMDGRFVKVETAGEIPGMGPFNGFGIYGYDNVGQKFQSSWIGNCGTGMMVGTGDLSSDGKTMTWTYTTNCPITKKPTTMREVEKVTGKDTKTLEMFAIDPKSGKEFKTMEIALTRKAGTPVSSAK